MISIGSDRPVSVIAIKFHNPFVPTSHPSATEGKSDHNPDGCQIASNRYPHGRNCAPFPGRAAIPQTAQRA